MAARDLVAGVYLVLERSGHGMKVAEMRQNKPAMRAGQVAVKVVLSISPQAFEQMIPTINVELHEGDQIEPTIEVEPPVRLEGDS